MSNPSTYAALEQDLQKYQDQFASANQLWKKNSKGKPFKQWLSDEVMKAKNSSWYKEGMNIAEIVQGNIDNTGTGEPNSLDNRGKAESKPFKIMGMNGWVVVIGGIAVVTTGVILYNKYKKSKSA